MDLTMQGSLIVQHQREPVQLGIAKALRFDRFYGGEHVIAIVARTAVALSDQAELLGKREPSCILNMATINHIGESADTLPCFVSQPNRTGDLAINVGGLFAAAQIFDRLIAPSCRHPEGDAATGAAAIEPKHKAGLLRCSAMVERIDAERAMFANQARRNLFEEIEARPPHQRPVAKHPQILWGGFLSGGGFNRHFGEALSEQ